MVGEGGEKKRGRNRRNRIIGGRTRRKKEMKGEGAKIR